MPSTRFRQLKRRIDDLFDLLPPISQTGSYSPQEYDLVRAFRVLAHAEIESYIEDRAMDYVNKATRLHQKNGRVSLCLLSLVAYDEAKREPPSSVLRPSQKSSPDVHERVREAKKRYTTYVTKNNHGIREENLLKLLVPLGIDPQCIDASFLPTMDSWGQSRGTVAHAAVKTYQPPDALSELQTVNQIVGFMESLDSLLSRP